MAYIQQREEDKEKKLGQEPVLIEGQGGAPLGLQSTGGAVPFTNVQAYLAAAQGDTRAKDAYQQEIEKTLGGEESKLKEAEQSYLKNLESIEPTKKEYEKGIGDIAKYREQYVGPNVLAEHFAPGRTRMIEAIAPEIRKGQFNAPSWGGYGFSSEFQALKPQLESEPAAQRAFLSWQQKQAGRPMTAGEMALSQQIAQQNVNFPELQKQLSTKYGAIEKSREELGQRLPKLGEQAAHDVNELQKRYESQYAKALQDISGFEQAVSSAQNERQKAWEDIHGKTVAISPKEQAEKMAYEHFNYKYPLENYLSQIAGLAKQYGLGPQNISPGISLRNRART